jgi:hypothetical protein
MSLALYLSRVRSNELLGVPSRRRKLNMFTCRRHGMNVNTVLTLVTRCNPSVDSCISIQYELYATVLDKNYRTVEIIPCGPRMRPDQLSELLSRQHFVARCDLGRCKH